MKYGISFFLLLTPFLLLAQEVKLQTTPMMGLYHVVDQDGQPATIQITSNRVTFNAWDTYRWVTYDRNIFSNSVENKIFRIVFERVGEMTIEKRDGKIFFEERYPDQGSKTVTTVKYKGYDVY